MDQESTLAISTSPALAELSDDAVAVVAGAARRRTLEAGEVLFAAGSDPDGMVVIDRGRLGLMGDDEEIVATMGRGDVVGEIGAITGRPRTGTVIALRDTSLLEIRQSDFDTMFDAHPDVGRSLTRLVVGRLVDGSDEHRAIPTTVAVATIGPDDTDQLIKALDRLAESAVVVTADLAERRTEADLLARLETLENDNELVVMLAGSAEHRDDWFDRCLRQADATLVAVTEPLRPVPDAARDLGERLQQLRSVVELVVVDPPDAEIGVDASGWIDATRPHRVHHVRRGEAASADRCARLVLGQGTALIFSGGAARGLAHLGAWRAITELGIDVDATAGVSLGSLLAAGVAIDLPPDELTDQVRERLVAERGLVDFTFPWVALLRGEGVSRRLREVGRGWSFEQTWRPFLCTSCDLTTGEIVEHRRGPLWEAVRASVSIPGILPPVRSGDRLLVDGAVRDNLPIATLRAAHPTPMRVIAVDVGKEGRFTAGDTPDGGHVSGWRLMARRLHPRRSDPGVPSIASMVMRVVELAGDEPSAPADVLIRPDLSELSLGDFECIDDFEQAGYEATITALG
jgi:predicted acylesterase/phospholipase RssA/CRP-like cAMP-binding protein